MYCIFWLKVCGLINAHKVEHIECPHSTLAYQGIIDNGGFEYFFESEFEGNPELESFVTVFNEIGAIESAKAIEKALELQNLEGINKLDYLDDIMQNNSESNYEKLAKYVENKFV